MRLKTAAAALAASAVLTVPAAAATPSSDTAGPRPPGRVRGVTGVDPR
ncbi:hypothetical protein EES41_38860 (plasmid) [Streptomyces sp. ADI95-16]|nr:hypothetical protein [Streptomyces sp. ADI95-16]AYV32732.1 hypothetical protein EES41_38860 [Streptomyces sp. ADI95-16]